MNYHYKLLITLLLTSLLPRISYLQCPLSVNAGPDLTVCTPGGTVTLTGSIAGNYLGFAWTPPAGLSNPSSLTPTTTVTGSATYTLTAQTFDPTAPNLLTNGNFEAGNTGFTSSYTLNPTLTTPGTYVLTTSPSLVLSTFPPCDDHTFGNGTGNMMLVNGAGSPGANIWCQTVPVMPNTWYVMSFWIITSPIAPAQLQFSVNGSPVGNVFQATPSLCQWQQFSTSWFSAGNATANVCIVSQNSGNGFFGDDYALDDISFSAACSVSDQVNVSVAQVNAVLPFSAFLPCNAVQTGIQLNGSASSSGPNIGYQWSGPGIVSGGNTSVATVNALGSYTLTVTYTNGPVVCSNAATIAVLPDPNTVVAAVTAPNNLNCLFPTVTLDGSGSSVGPTVSYNWSFVPSPGGVPPGIASGGSTPNPVVTQPGTYTLTVTNAASGCTATASVQVTANFTPPIASASTPGPLSCTTNSVTLSGAGSSTGLPFTYFWETTGGNIVSGATTLNNCVVNAPGTYTLTVTNPQNGCTAIASTVVAGNTSLPIATATTPASLDCGTPTLQLDGSGSSTGSGFTYQWATSNGNITAGATTLSPTVNLAGSYTLTVTNTANGCSSSATVAVTGNATLPLAEAGPPLTLNCSVSSVTLNGSASSIGAGFSYSWTTSGGIFLSGETTLTPIVIAPGLYVLTVTNTANGCTAVDSTTVLQDGNAPFATIDQPGSLNCETTTLTLDAGASSVGGGIQIAWTTNGGSFVAGETTLTPLINAPGIYTLTLTNTGNSCSASASVTVLQNIISPTANAGPGVTLTCISPTASLNGGNSSQGGNFSYLWNFTPPPGGANGGILSGETTLTPIVDAPGVYSLTVTNIANHCTATATTVVTENTALPYADAGAPIALTCAANSAFLDGSASSQGPYFTYHWAFVPPAGGSTGGIVSGEMTLSPLVNGGGQYFLTVTDTTNGCTAVDSVAVSVSADFPSVQIAPPDTLTCAQPQLTLSAVASMGAAFSYQWTTLGGNFISGETTLSPLVNAPGTYFLTVTNTQNGCSTAAAVVVDEDLEAPMAEAGQPFQLSCSLTSAQLDGTGSSTGSGLSYFWTTTNGNITAGQNTLTPSITAPGTYILTITNNANGCTDHDFVNILQDANAPTADAGSAPTLTCFQSIAILDGNASSSGPGINYQWTTQDGNILSGETTLNPVVNAPGTYLLTVLNQANNCQTIASVQVLDFTQPPGISIAAPQSLTCANPTVLLNASASGGNLLMWDWDGPGISSGETTPSPLVNAPGVYSLTVTNPQNGCTAAATVMVAQTTQPPIAIVATPPALTCVLGEIQLNGSGSSTGGNFTYLWVYTPSAGSTGGGILSGESTLTPFVNGPGTYTLTVTNQLNGCSAFATAIVTENKALPVANAGTAPSFGCVAGGTLVLDGSGSSTGGNFTYTWATQDGHILTGANTLMPIIDAPGLYTLTVTNQQNGCTAFSTVMVADGGGLPDVFISLPGMLTCAVPQLVLDASASSSGPAFSYAWTTTAGHILTGENSPNPTIAATGNYILTVTNQQNGCTASASVMVTENITPPGASALADTITCKELQVALTGSSPTFNVTYHWTTTDGHFIFGETTPVPGVDAIGTYTLTVTNPANGCTSSASVTVVAVVLEDFNVEIKNPDCLTGVGSIVFTNTTGGTPPYRYSIDGGASFSQEPIFEELAAGVYDLMVKDDESCKLTGTAVLTDPPGLTIDLDSMVTLNLGDTWQFDPKINVSPFSLAEIQWTPGDRLSCDDCLRPVVTAEKNVLYTIKIMDENGCTAMTNTSVIVLRRLDVYVPNAFSPNGDGINDVLLIFSKANQVAVVSSFKIFTRWGESVFEGFNFPPNDALFGWNGTHRGRKLDVGVYVWFAELELVNGEREVLKGEVMLVR